MMLLDTNVLIHYLKGNPGIVAQMRNTPRRELAIPAIVLYELEYGTLRSKLPPLRRRELAAGLQHMRHIPFNSDAAIAAARLRMDVEMRGLAIGPLDTLIAGTAVSRGAALVTNNAAEFSRIPALRVIDWRSA
jgi:tRNA(fMet)-specific endonuclease VapC